jgi:hypothetical protein
VNIATEKREKVCSADTGGVITSGGGFSYRFPRPYYQGHFVEKYLNHSGLELPPEDFYFAGGRGYPDIAAYGNNFVVIMKGNVARMSGTSASAPVIAAMITHWNEIRLSQHLPPLGFINPLLYSLASAHPEAFNDVVVGDNRCGSGKRDCCKGANGWFAAPGWDAVTGLGTPDFQTISELIAAMGSDPRSSMRPGPVTPVPTNINGKIPPAHRKGPLRKTRRDKEVSAADVGSITEKGTQTPMDAVSVKDESSHQTKTSMVVCALAIMAILMALLIFKNKMDRRRSYDQLK